MRLIGSFRSEPAEKSIPYGRVGAWAKSGHESRERLQTGTGCDGTDVLGGLTNGPNAVASHVVPGEDAANGMTYLAGFGYCAGVRIWGVRVVSG
jgi:hypothetical protein